MKKSSSPERSPRQSSPEKPSQPPVAVESAVKAVGRRIFMRTLALAGAAGVADQVAQGSLSKAVFGTEKVEEKALTESKEVLEKIEQAAHDIAGQFQESGQRPNQLTAMRKTIDYLGTGLFVQGVLQLIFVKENNHINSYQYAILAILNGLKYQLSSHEEREHLIKEHQGAIKTGLLIGGAMTIGEGVDVNNQNIMSAWEAKTGKPMLTRDKVALMTTLSLGVSSIGTTLVNSSVVRSMANDLADTGERDANGKPVLDANIMAICTGHNTNLSGIALFGNPPFMAVCEKYGFAEGIKWKLKTMLPLAIYSWFSHTFKLNLAIAKREGLTGAQAFKKAKEDTLIGLLHRENIQFMASTIVKSLGNAAKYFAGVSGKQFEQDSSAIEIRIGEIIFKKITQLGVKLPFSEHLEHEGEHGDEGIVHPHDLSIEGADTIVKEYFKTITPTDTATPSTDNLIDQLIEHRDYQGLNDLAKKANMPELEALVKILADFHDDKQINKSTEQTVKSTNWRSALNPVNIADRATDMNRIKAAAGHNLADVINVFPFQAGCIPFLVPVFKEALATAEKNGLKGISKEITIFFMLQIFSMFADNYVACKIGLELLPDSPQIALLGSELGGPFTPIANMSNLGQFSMNDFPMATALAKAYWHVDSTVVALAWSQALGIMGKMPFFKAPKNRTAVKAPPQSHAAVN